MSREIKYRVWVNTISSKQILRGMIKNKMLPVTGLHFWEGDKLNSISIDSEYGELQDLWLKDIDVVLMQFTGLRDVNGTDIYEGDIIDPKTYPSDISKVVYTNHAFRLQPKGSKGFLSDHDEGGWLRHWDHMEVVGNVFENPTLLQTEGD